MIFLSPLCPFWAQFFPTLWGPGIWKNSVVLTMWLFNGTIVYGVFFPKIILRYIWVLKLDQNPFHWSKWFHGYHHPWLLRNDYLNMGYFLCRRYGHWESSIIQVAITIVVVVFFLEIPSLKRERERERKLIPLKDGIF